LGQKKASTGHFDDFQAVLKWFFEVAKEMSDITFMFVVVWALPVRIHSAALSR